MRLYFYLLVVLLCIPLACSAAIEIQPSGSGTGYFWLGSTLTIVDSGEYTFADAPFPTNLVIDVIGSSVTLTGRSDVPIAGIRGQPDLDLKNVHIYGGIPDESDLYGITVCRDIESSSIAVSGSNLVVSGIETVYGKMDGTTITVTGGTAHGVVNLYGTISSGTFTVTGTGQTNSAYGVVHLYGAISGGTFTVTGGGAHGVVNLYGTISDGTFTVTRTGQATASGASYGVGGLPDNGTISGGTFTVTGTGQHENEIYGLALVGGTISGGTFAVTNEYGPAYGIGGTYGAISDGEFIVTSQNGPAYGIGGGGFSGTISGGTFTVTSEYGLAYGLQTVSSTGTISDGEFIVTSQDGPAYGVGMFSGTISDGKFIVTSQDGPAFGVGTVDGDGIISNGIFWSVSTEQAYGIYEIYGTKPVKEVVTGGTINAWSPTEETSTAIGDPKLTDGEYIPDYTFTSPINGEQYTKDATVYTIDGADGATLREIYDPAAPPLIHADFNAIPRSGPAPLTVSFTDLSTNAAEWHWSFGTPECLPRIGQNPPPCTYTEPGTYTVTLQVKDKDGNSDIETKMSYITVIPPVVDRILWFEWDITTPPRGVTFSVYHAPETYDDYYWYFSDGSYPLHCPPENECKHEFKKDGKYSVELIAVNSTTEKKDTVVRLIDLPMSGDTL